MLLALVAAAAPAEPSVSKGLEPLAFLVGHCWRGKFSDGPVDTHCFESVYGGKHIRDRHEVIGDRDVYRGETIYSWNEATRRVDYTYWNSLGGMMRGSMVPKGSVLQFADQKHLLADGSKLSISTMWRPSPSADAYEVLDTRYGINDGVKVTYRRAD